VNGINEYLDHTVDKTQGTLVKQFDEAGTKPQKGEKRQLSNSLQAAQYPLGPVNSFLGVNS
jgi:hypothetical protein